MRTASRSRACSRSDSISSDDAALVHLRWTLGFDWGAVSHAAAGRSRKGALSARLTRWRAGRAGTEAFVDLAGSPRPVGWTAMCDVQRALCGVDRFRDNDAHCRDRTYGWAPGLEARFIRKVEADAAADLHPIAKAIRLYLDVIHVHPFADGNARAAVLWAGWTLENAGWTAPDMEAVVRVPKPPGVDAVVGVMARLME